MEQKVIVIGAGIIGAQVAFRLQAAGAQVVVVDAGHASATAASFGWINAAFFLDDDHFRLRAEAIAAYRRLDAQISVPITWCGTLCFENEGQALKAQSDALKTLGYDHQIIEEDAFARLVPAMTTRPERCLMFEQEGAADSAAIASRLLDAAAEKGAQVIHGVQVEEIIVKNGRARGIRTNAGGMTADTVVSAVGTATQNLLQAIDVNIPLLTRPAAMVRTRPTQRIMDHILVTPQGEIRQLADGAVLTPAAIGHQQDSADQLPDAIDIVAETALKRLQTLFPDVPLLMGDVTLAHRPMPQDERPVVGHATEGLYVACMHSGITLGAFMGELIAAEVLAGPSNATAQWLAHYRPDRFAI